jgi:phosphate transport system substrate-binding protein
MHPHRARLTLLLSISAVFVLAPLLPMPGGRSAQPSAAAQGRVVTVSPSTGMVAGSTVRVRWEGFAPGPAYLHQCTAGAVRWSQCAEATRVVGLTGPDGRGEIDFTVFRSAGSQTLPTIPDIIGGGNFPIGCNALIPCEIVVSECGFGIGARSARAAMSFAPGGANPSPTTTGPLVTSTTSLPTIEPSEKEPISAMAPSSALRFIDEVQFVALERPDLRLNLDITRQNSPNANAAFASGGVDFAVSSLALTDDEQAAVVAAGRQVAYVPIAVSALTIPLQLRVNGIAAKEMDLAPATLAAIYNGEMSNWNDPRIVDDNGGCAIEINSRRYPVASFRTDTSGSNWLFSSWLDATAKDEWGLGVDSRLPIIDSQTYGRLGDEELSKFIVQGDPAIDHATSSGAGRIGFVDRSWARVWGVPEIGLRNGAGEYVTPTDEAILEAIDEAAPTPGEVLVPDFASTRAGAYPMPIVYYAIVQTNLDSKYTPAKAQNLKDLLGFLVSEEGQALAAEQGFVPLPESLLTIAQAEIDRIDSTGGGPPTTLGNGGPDGGFAPQDLGAGGAVGGSSFAGGIVGSTSPALSSGSSFATGTSDEAAVGEVTIDDSDEDSGPIAALRSILGNPAAMLALPVVLGLGLAAAVGGQVLRRTKDATT